MEQTTLSPLPHGAQMKKTRCAAFLAEMDSAIVWARFVRLIEPIYLKSVTGPPPHPLERMLRIHFMQIWFNMSDPQAEDSLYDIESMRCFAGIPLQSDSIPDELTILRFRHLLEEHHLAEPILTEVRSFLDRRDVPLSSSTFADAHMGRDTRPMWRSLTSTAPNFESGRRPESVNGQVLQILGAAECLDRVDGELTVNHRIRTHINGLIIRRAIPDDARIIRQFIVELAKHHECLGEVTITEHIIRTDFFSSSPRANAAVAEDELGVCGMITWYYDYSTYRGRVGIHAEDCYVTSRRLSLGLGKGLMRYLADLCVSEGHNSVNWISLRTNTRTIDMLESIGARKLEGFDAWKWDGDALLQAHMAVRADQCLAHDGETIK